MAIEVRSATVFAKMQAMVGYKRAARRESLLALDVPHGPREHQQTRLLIPNPGPHDSGYVFIFHQHSEVSPSDQTNPNPVHANFAGIPSVGLVPRAAVDASLRASHAAN